MRSFQRPTPRFAASMAGLVLTALSAPALENSGFETPDQGAGGFAYRPADAGWTFLDGAGVSGPNGPWRCATNSPDPLGDQFGYLQRAASISQDITGLTVGATYAISFYESYRTAYLSENDLSVIIDEGLGTEATIYNNPGVTNGAWEARTTDAFVASAPTHSLTFRSTDPINNGDRTVIIDGVVLTTVTVPGNPVVDTLSPADDAADVPTTAVLSVTFDRSVSAATGNITLKNKSTMSDTVIPIDDPRVSIDGKILTITPANPLAPTTDFAVAIDAGAVVDVDGDPFAGIADDGSWTFATGTPDVTAPEAASLSPVPGLAGVPVTSSLVVTFDEMVRKAAGNIVITRSSDGAVVETIDVTTDAVAIDGAVVTIDPGVVLEPGRGHHVEIDPGTFQDTSGNAFAGITGGSAWSFFTSAFYYLPITGDADSGIDSSKTYTHALDFGNNNAYPVAVVNGVTFANGGGAGPFPADPGASHTVGAGTSNVPSSHQGNATANDFLVDGGMEDLVGDMTYNAPATVITLVGLTPGQPYSFRLYHRPWAVGGTRQQAITFDTDGAPGAEGAAAFDQDDASQPDPGLASGTQVHALAFDYALPPGQTTLTVNINNTAGGTYHLYGFTNEETTDTVGPELLAVDPANGTTDLLTYANLSATFTEGVAIGTGTITLKNTTDAVDTVITLPDPRVTVSGNTLVINPDTNLAGNKDFAVLIDAGAVTDIVGNPFGGIADDGKWTFTTGMDDFDAPLVATLTPARDEDSGSRVNNLIVRFDEEIKKGAGTIVIRLSSDGSVVETIDVNSPAAIVSGTELIINPANTLAPAAGHYVEIDAGAVADFYDNPFAGLTGASAWNFTTNSPTNDITYVGITGDADSGIDGAKTYTHALDFGNGAPGGLVNGLRFDAYGGDANGSLDFNRTVETGNLLSHPGNAGHNVTGGLADVLTDMYYNYPNAPGGRTSWTLSGLTAGEQYDLRIYTRQWDPGTDRLVTLVFDPDGPGPIEDPTDVISQDEASSVGFATDNQAYFINYRFTAVEGEDLVITAIQDEANNSWHLYGITNEVVGSGSDYGAWAANYPGADLFDTDADLDGDGLSNDAERLFGLDPTDPASVDPISVPLDPADGTLSFTRRTRALTGMSYSVWTSTDLVAWTRDGGAVLTPGTPVDDIETVAVTLGASPAGGRLFVQIRAGLLFFADFEESNGNFTAENKGTGTELSWGAPDTLGLGGGDITSGNAGSFKCWATNLIGGYAAGTDVCLRSPVIDLAGVAGATLSFAGAIDADTGHTFEVNLIEAGTEAVIANLVPPTGDDDQAVAPWQQVGPIPLPAAALAQPFRIEWRFIGDGNGGFGGVYVDDVVIMETLP